MFKKKVVVKKDEVQEKTGVIEANLQGPPVVKESKSEEKVSTDPLLEGVLSAFNRWRGGVSADAMISLPAWNIEVEKAGLLFSIFSELHVSNKLNSANFEKLVELLERNNQLMDELIVLAKAEV